MWLKIVEQKAPEGDGGAGGGASGEAGGDTGAAAASPAPAPAAAPAAAPAPAAQGEDGKGYWPADWREKASAGDKKIGERLGRYASPEAVAQALIAAQNRISSGELKPVLGKNATPEQMAEWRQAHGIPESPDKYDLGDAAAAVDPEILSAFLKDAHATNQTPDQVKASLKALANIGRSMVEQRAERDAQFQQESEDALRAEWGPEFRRNVNLIHGLLDSTASQELKDKVLNSRLPDGRAFGSDPDVMRLLASLALIQNPAGVVVPSGGGDPLKGIEEEMKAIESKMGTKAYINDEKMQARYRELVDAKNQNQARRAA